MEIRAYGEDYLELAQKNLGNMLDYAVNSLQYDLKRFYDMFLVSGLSKQFENGNPKYIAGMTGCELAKEVLCEIGQDISNVEDEMYLDKSPEYWTGWALAFYQWYSALRFGKIQKAVPVTEVLGMYPTMHEADLMKFVSVMDEKVRDYYIETNLKRIRKLAGYSQSELAQEAGVSIRQIQMLEQRKRDMNKVQLMTAVRLSKALRCSVEDLVEY